jgi:aromatic-L-amino-acid decarboxylase
VPVSTGCFRATPDLPPAEQDAFNERLLAQVNAAGPVLISHTQLRQRYVMRLTVGNLRTRREHIERAWELIRSAREALQP